MAVVQAPVLHHICGDETERASRGIDPCGLGEHRTGIGKRGDHQPVPIGEDLVVPTGADPRLARLEEDRAGRGERRFVTVIAKLGPLGSVEDGFSFPVAFGRDVVGVLEPTGVGPQQIVGLRRRPDVVLAFLAFAVGIEGAGEAAALGHHLPQHPGHRLGDAHGIKRALGLGIDQGEDVDHLGVVVEHLFEMGHQPGGVGGVAGETAAEMIVDAALAHLVEAQHHGVAESLVAGALIGAPDELVNRDMGKLRRAADAAVDGVEVLEHPLGDMVGDRKRDRTAAGGLGELGKGLAKGRDVGRYLCRLLLVELGDAAQDVLEAGLAVAADGRKVGAAPERFAVGRQEHGQRPAATLTEKRQGGLVDGVDVGTLLAIDLDVDEELVHQRRGFGILETFMGHDMTPVTGGVADRKHDRFLGPLGELERARPPRLPVDGVALVLQEVRAGFR